MARQAKRQSEAAALKELVKEKTAENTELRKAARQLMQGLTEYAKADNWKVEGTLTDDGTEMDRYVWKSGEGSKIARRYLGLEEDAN